MRKVKLGEEIPFDSYEVVMINLEKSFTTEQLLNRLYEFPIAVMSIAEMEENYSTLYYL